jgi:SAM-dependent methyltransferase
MRGRDLNDLLASAKVVVGDSLCVDFKKAYYTSDRPYEVAGRGGFQIFPYIKGLDEEFVDGETIVFYEFGNFGQLREKIDYYLAHDEQRERIRAAGQAWVREHATYHDRMRQLLDTVFPTIMRGNWFIDRSKAAGEQVFGDNLRINLGAGGDPKPGFLNVDRLDLPGIGVVHNLMQFPYPFEDGVAAEIHAVDVVEHLANYTDDGRPGVIALVEECHRILKPGGELYIQTPGYKAEFAWQDPTHVRPFHPRTFDLFDPDTEYGKTNGYYSKATFRVRSEELDNGNLRINMVKRS